jgi:hypothetical protein
MKHSTDDNGKATMKKTLELNADQLHEVVRGLDLRAVECEKILKRSKGAQAQREWTEQLVCARMTLERAEAMQHNWPPGAAVDTDVKSGLGSNGLLPDMTYSLDSVPVGSPAWHARSGWNSAVIHLADRQRTDNDSST